VTGPRAVTTPEFQWKFHPGGPDGRAIRPEFQWKLHPPPERPPAPAEHVGRGPFPWTARLQRQHNGLLRQYLPKGTDLRLHAGSDLDAIAQASTTTLDQP
jgi:hypothetical protein